MQSIEEIFADKGFSCEILGYLENFINEFEELEGKYVPRDELIKRINRRVDKIEFTDSMKKSSSGSYNAKKKELKVRNGLDEEEIKEVFYHEGLHAEVSDDDGNVGFCRVFQIDNFDDDVSVRVGRGWNEGSDQWLTTKRNKRFAKKDTRPHYPILTAMVGKFIEIIGEEEFSDTYHNRPDEITDLLLKNLKFDYYYQDDSELNMYSVIEFLEDFDIVHNYEKDVRERKQKNFFEEVLGIDRINERENLNQDLAKAQENILQVYLNTILQNEITNADDFEKIYHKVNEMHKISARTISMETLEKIVDKLNPEIIKEINEKNLEGSDLIISYLKFREFENLTTDEKLKTLSNDEGIVLDLLERLDSSYFDKFCVEILSSLYDGEKKFDYEDAFYILMSFKGVAQYILDNKLNFDNLKIDFTQFDLDRIYDVYSVLQDGNYKKIVSLKYNINDNASKVLNEPNLEEQRELIEKYPEMLENTISLGDNEGIYIVRSIDGKQKLFSTEYEEFEEPKKSISLDSVNDLKIQRYELELQSRQKRMERNKGLGIPAIIIEHEQKQIEKIESDIEKIIETREMAEKSGKINPLQIEEIAKDSVTINSLEKTVNKYLTTEYQKKEGETK